MMQNLKKWLPRVFAGVAALIAVWSILCAFFDEVAVIVEKREITVDQPIDKVFDFLTDDSKVGTWVNGIESIEPVGEVAEGVGAQAMIKVSVPYEMEMISTVTVWDPPREFAWSVDVPSMASTQTYTLEEANDGTRIKLHVEHRPRGFWMKVFSPLMGFIIKRERAKEMVRLQEVLENI